MSKLDDISWHTSSPDFPNDVPKENGATHIGFFVSWAIARGLWGDFLPQKSMQAIELMQGHHMSGRDFVLQECDGKLLSEMLTREGERFANSYYQKRYIKDYKSTLAVSLDSDYLVQDSEKNAEFMAEVVEARYKAWRGKPWWKLW